MAALMTASSCLRAPTPLLAKAARPARLAPRAAPIRASCSKHEDSSAPLASERTLSLAALVAAGLVAPVLLDVEAAQAVPELLKGRTFSLIHPAVMSILFGSSVYAGWLGFQWRRTRELAGEIKGLKAQLPAPGADGVRPPSPLDAQVATLEAERKELIGQKLNEKHGNLGSLILGLGVTISVSGAYNTFLRTGKLFPGPHLWAGAVLTVIWALAASLVPAMQKGNEAARSAHIGLNVLGLALFAWQIPTGFDIVAKVFEFTSWP